MATDAPFVGHDPVAVLLLALVGLVTTASLGVMGLVRTVRTVRGEHRGLAARLRTAGSLAFTGAVGVYTWGMLHLAVLDESARADACHEALGSALVAYEPTYVPLAFGCVADNGRTYDAAVPGYVNPLAGLLGISAFCLTVFGFAEAHHDKKDDDR
ncbi:hypothetical protein [Streptomyces sp. NPDC049906]|uniref:hypothetical protein n=1 Tax=Streptomyces sp. NPDC049906 TaxID=3155656 RepID=UPI003424484B